MKKTIAAQVIAGDPFMFNVFINTFFDKWYHLVDRLYVQVKTIPGSIVGKNPILKQFIYNVCRNDPKIVISEFDDDFTKLNYKNFDFSWYPKQEQTWTGFCMRHVVDISNEDIIFFTHDDCFIVDPEKLKYHINLVSSGEKDMVFDAGSILSHECAELALQQYPFITDKLKENLDWNKYKYSVGLTTSYFIVNRVDLLKTKLNFDGWTSQIFDKPFGLEVGSHSKDKILTLEFGHDVLFQLYKNGKINPYISAEETSHFVDIHDFKTNYDNIKNIKRSSGHVHLAGGSWSHVIYCVDMDEYISSMWNVNNLENKEYINYDNIRKHERHICCLLSFMDQLDLEKYPYMTDFYNDIYGRITKLVEKINILLKNKTYDNEFFENISFHDTLCNDLIPYQIDINKLPKTEFSQIYL
jgi:hypothetical protein